MNTGRIERVQALSVFTTRDVINELLKSRSKYRHLYV